MFTLSQNPNTGISGTSDYYLRFSPETKQQVVSLSNPEIYDKMGEDLTIELWFRKTVGPGDYRPMVNKHPQNNIDNGLCEYLIEVQYNDGLNFFSGCGSFVNYGYYTAVDQRGVYPNLRKYIVKKDRWTHVAASVDWRQDVLGIPTGIAKVYADGILVDASLWGASSPYCNGRKRIRQPGVPVRLGYFDNQDPGFQYWVGDLDELRIWNVARTEEEIRKYYVGGIPLDSKGIVSYHTFSEGTGHSQSINIILDTDGYPVVNIPDDKFWWSSDLKLTPNTAVTCPGYSVSQQPIGTPDVDFYIIKIVQNTDAKFLWTDWRIPVARNIRREITQADLPLNIGPWALANIVEYMPGVITGIDTIYYEARNNGSFPEPSGPASLVFETVCCGDEKPDKCRSCRSALKHEQTEETGHQQAECPNTCDGKGGINDQCGVCNGDGSSCRGCDGIPFSSQTYDLCGICGGNNTCSEACDNGVIDDCGVCNGTNACCVNYRGVPKDRIDHILIDYSLNQLISKLQAARSILSRNLEFVNRHNLMYSRNQYWNPVFVDIPTDLPISLSNRITAINSFCQVTDGFIDQLDVFLDAYGQEIRIPYPPLDYPFNIADANSTDREYDNLRIGYEFVGFR